jgi:hypothetical protein
MIVSDIANPELETALEVAVDHFVGGRRTVQVIHPHLVLLSLVAREDNDLGRSTEIPCQGPSNQCLSQ